MAIALPDIDFHAIRPYGQPASRWSAFEELASILIEQSVVEWPLGVRFDRFGNPDGGREGKGVLPNGDVWAWQAKYLFEFDSSAAGQVTSSVRRVLSHEPNLKRYLVAMPLDMPAGDTEDRSSAYTRWTEKVSEWEALANEIGLEVEFVFVGAHRLLTALTEPRHAGRVRYWFGADVLTPEWQGRRLEEVIAKVGRRYTPRIHVEVETVRALDAVGRVDAYVARWQRVLADIREARRWPWQAPGDVADAFTEALPWCATALDEADAALALMIAAARSTDDLPRLEGVLDVAAQAVGRIDDLLHQHSLTKHRYFVGDAASLYSKVRDAVDALRRAERLAHAATTQAARAKVLLLVGRAGVGKTHLLCDVATRRIADGRPTILLLGQDFDIRSLLPQIGELAQLGGSVDDVLAVLDAAAEAAGCTALFMIDALNESERPERWRDDAQALIAAAARCPHLALVLSCRTEFVEAVVGDEQVTTVEHFGFAEATDVAVHRFTQEFGLEPPTFPVLNPEFGNPLFLKLTCEALATLGATRFPFGTAGLATVCDAFLEAVNKRLSEPGRSDYDERSDPVRRAIREIALLGRGALDRADVRRITDEALPDRPWSRSLMRGLIAEGVLMALSDGRVTFGYQRLGDMIRAAAIAEKAPEDVRAWLKELADHAWRERGVLGALAVIVPERHGVELVDLAVDDDGRVSYDVVDSFLESLLLRSPESVSARAVEIVQRLLDSDHRVDEIWDRLIRIACVPDHALNAKWLHARLASHEVADRDRSWSTWLVGAADTDDESSVRRLLEWAWPADLRDRLAVPDDVAELATLMFGWLLATSDRRVRDRATKAIVSLAERAPAAFAKTLGGFRGTNDPYVVERLAAAACGVVLRSDDADSAQRIADGASELVADGWPTHLITRDFVRRVFGVARAHEPAGHLYGRSRATGAPIVLDRFAHACHNAIVLGQTGTGKTMFTGAEMTRCFVRGIRVLAVDPLGDYRRLADALGGTYVELGASGGLNPFALTRGTSEGALGAKLAMLSRLVGAMAGGLSRDERPALDRALRAAYDGCGIGPDPATHGRRAPTLETLVARLADTPGGAPLARRLERWATGSLASLFTADEALPLDRRVLIIGLAGIGDPEVRDIAQLAALGLLWDAVRADLAPKLVVVDEAWKVMRQPSGADFIEELARSARHYHAGIQLATQDIVEFLRSDFGEAIVKQCDLRVLLGQTPEGADALTRYFDLTPAERRTLVHARPGEGLLFVGRSHVSFEAIVSRREYAMLTTRPADLVGQSHSRYEPQ